MIKLPGLLAGGLVGAALVATACGGGSTPQVASLGSTSSVVAASASNSSTQNRYQDALKYSQCMRANGVTDFPDPSSSGRIEVQGGFRSLDPSSPTFQAAAKACAKYRPKINLTPAQIQQFQQDALKLAQCMRANGVPNFPDPQISSGGGGFGIRIGNGGAFSGMDPNSPQFQSAMQTCRKNLPGGGRFFGGRGGGGGAPPPPGGSGSTGSPVGG